MLEDYLLVLVESLMWHLARLHYLMSWKGGCVGFMYMLHSSAIFRLSDCIYATINYIKKHHNTIACDVRDVLNVIHRKFA